MEFFSALTWIDIVVIVVIVASTLLSLARGLIKEVASLAVWVIAVVGASRLAHHVADLLPQWLTAPIQQTVGFLVVLVLILLIGKLVTMALKEIVSAAGIATFDRFLGTFFGLARGVLMVVVLAVLAAMTSLPGETAWKEAKTRSFLELGIRTATPWLPSAVEERLRKASTMSRAVCSVQQQGAGACVA
jgi:membrane protein required for colicin V production